MWIRQSQALSSQEIASSQLQFLAQSFASGSALNTNPFDEPLSPSPSDDKVVFIRDNKVTT